MSDVQAAAAAGSSGSAPSTSRIDTGRPRGLVPHLGRAAANTRTLAPGVNPHCASCTPPLVYHSSNPVAGGISHLSGPVGAVTITPYYWDPLGYSYNTTTYETIVNGYIANLAADSGKASNVFAMANQYYQTFNGSTQPLRYAIAAGPPIVDTTGFPATKTVGGNASGCDPAILTDACVSDGDLQARLQIKLVGHYPTDDSHIYMVMFPNHVETCLGPGAAPSQSCSTNSYCAYHGGVNLGGNGFILYANEPFPDLLSCTGPLGAQQPNGDQEADTVLSSFSHEANEIITDAFDAWYDVPSGSENGDECAYTFGNALGGSPGSYYNQIINGYHYWTQMEWSNEDYALGQGDPVDPATPAVVYGCRQQEEPPTAAFAAPSPTVNVAVAFDGGPSSDVDHASGITGYTWSWGDGTANDTGPTPTHTFTSVGTFSVTLTVTDADGWTGTVTHSVYVGAVVPNFCAGTPLYTSYFNWFDNATAGMVGDNIHILNTGGSMSSGCVTVGGQAVNFSVAAGQEQHVTLPAGTIGGPVVVTVTSGPPVLASQRVQYFQSFNEVWALTAGQAATTSYIHWFDTATPGMVGDNIHVLNPGSSSANVTVSLAGATPILFTLGPGVESHVTFPGSHLGGPVTISSTQPVLASQRVQYYQSFNEVVAQNAAQATTTNYFNWFDTATPGMVGDNIHILNPGGTSAAVTVSLPGAPTQVVTAAAGAEIHVTFPSGAIGGPVTVTSTQPVLASQRVQYFQSFNEVPSSTSGKAGTTGRVLWYDLATPGMVGDNIHVLNPGGIGADVTVSLSGARPITFALAAGAETHVTFPNGTFGGPVVVSSSQPVIVAQRVQYFSSFNEVLAG